MKLKHLGVFIVQLSYQPCVCMYVYYIYIYIHTVYTYILPPLPSLVRTFHNKLKVRFTWTTKQHMGQIQIHKELRSLGWLEICWNLYIFITSKNFMSNMHACMMQNDLITSTREVMFSPKSVYFVNRITQRAPNWFAPISHWLWVVLRSSSGFVICLVWFFVTRIMKNTELICT